MRIKRNLLRVTNWRVGDIFEDVRDGETKGMQFEVVDYDGNCVELHPLSEDEWVKSEFLTSLIR
jgi:hypothetical protein